MAGFNPIQSRAPIPTWGTRSASLFSEERRRPGNVVPSVTQWNIGPSWGPSAGPLVPVAGSPLTLGTIQTPVLMPLQGVSLEAPLKAYSIGFGICEICVDDIWEGEKVIALPCGHNFHRCVLQFARANGCPLCRRAIADGWQFGPCARVVPYMEQQEWFDALETQDWAEELDIWKVDTPTNDELPRQEQLVEVAAGEPEVETLVTGPQSVASTMPKRVRESLVAQHLFHAIAGSSNFVVWVPMVTLAKGSVEKGIANALGLSRIWERVPPSGWLEVPIEGKSMSLIVIPHAMIGRAEPGWTPTYNDAEAERVCRLIVRFANKLGRPVKVALPLHWYRASFGGTERHRLVYRSALRYVRAQVEYYDDDG